MRIFEFATGFKLDLDMVIAVDHSTPDGYGNMSYFILLSSGKRLEVYETKCYDYLAYPRDDFITRWEEVKCPSDSIEHFMNYCGDVVDINKETMEYRFEITDRCLYTMFHDSEREMLWYFKSLYDVEYIVRCTKYCVGLGQNRIVVLKIKEI